MKPKGYYLALEATVSLVLLGLLLSMPLHQARPGLNNLQIFKKENDLLALWSKEWPLKGEELLQDCRFAFGGKGCLVSVDGQEFSFGEKSAESLASRAVFFDRWIAEHEIVLTVFK